ncbi:MAG: bifunctional oligoribonuclease/PAP phosphatase NrnA [Fusobacterium sp. JB021]|nr:bifunctional oligoribonuclease/PAP phosphatase NrnA [Fusobacterium sp. JB021]MDP0506143.1 bifunctional oligoribonuclease/PAP phosphatase NrnA [Fusobacterium sp. JB019]
MLLEKLKESENILISSHVNPDGDSIGSGLAIYNAIVKNFPEKKVRFIIEDDIPYDLKFLAGSDEVEKYIEIENAPEVDLMIACDSATFKRVGRVVNFKKDAFLVNIDHHISNELYGDLNIVEDKSSTCEIMYDVIKNRLKLNIDKEIGEALYTGIVTDTGSFKYESTTKSTFEIAGKLIDIGIDRNKIINSVYKSKSIGRMKVLGIAISKMNIIEDRRFVYFTLSDYFVQTEGIKKDDTEGIVEQLLEYEGCEVALFLKEEPNGKMKGSLRSKKEIDVNEIASLFDGGGHKRAAGFTTNMEERDIIFQVLENI